MTTSQLEFVPFPYADAAYEYAGQKLADNWDRLHQGDAEPWPEDEQVQDAWRAYHAGILPGPSPLAKRPVRRASMWRTKRW